MAAPAVAPATLELSCLSSDLLSKVTHFLDTIELRFLDTAINNRQLRAKFLFGVANNTYLFKGKDIRKEEEYVQWLLLRRVFLRSISLHEDTTASTLLLYEILNRASCAGLEELTLDGNVDFPKDLAVRSAKTLHTLVLKTQIVDEGGRVQGVFKNIREWRLAGGVLKRLTLDCCEFGDAVVDVGDCTTLTHLQIEGCVSSQYTAPGVSQGCTHLIWDIVSKCVNLRNFQLDSVNCPPIFEPDFCLCDRDVSVLARFCPDLTHLCIYAEHKDCFAEKALIHLATKCTKIEHLCLFLKTQFTDATITAVAANLVSLSKLGLSRLQLRTRAHCGASRTTARSSVTFFCTSVMRQRPSCCTW
jgi:hypothetical protein